MILLILPNQLFDIKYFPKNNTKVFLWEHPHYFKKYNYNRLKLILHRASMKLYEKYLKSKNITVEYYTYNEKPKLTKIIMFEQMDNINLNVNLLENPNFLLDNNLREQYRKKTDKFFFNNFYNFNKKQLNIIPDIQSTDKFNRKKIPDILLKKIPNRYLIKFNIDEKNILKESINYIQSNFKNNPGPEWNDIQDNWNYPLTHEHAKKQFKYFIKYKINNFGPYQDYIYFENDDNVNNLFHSNLSSSLNIGLLNPKELIYDLIKINNLNSKEAFIRQLFWREYQLYCFKYCKELSTSYLDNNKSFFNNSTKNLNKNWYNGSIGIYPVDYCIKKAFKNGYLHHIERLMIIGNFMLLSGIKPSEGFKWFMDFSIDSYEWIMYQNVYDMVFFITGGKTMRRPYFSSSNYIIKMSNVKKKDTLWIEKWDILYHNFLKNNKNKIGFPYNIKSKKK